jgi:AcrR family transcriptional regulator
MTAAHVRQSEETRRSILKTAGRLFNTYGYDATSMQAITDELGLTKSAVCSYFPDKREILFTLARRTARQYGAMLNEVSQLPDGPARANSMIEQYVSLTVANRDTQILRRTDPGIRRELQAVGIVDALAQRGMEVLFGASPAAEQRIAYYLMLDLEGILENLRDLGDEELGTLLRAAAQRLLRPVMIPGTPLHEFPASGGLAWH